MSNREKVFNIPSVIFIFIILCCFAYVIPNYILPSRLGEAFYSYLSFIPAVYIYNPDLLSQFSTVSYSFLHGNFTHLGLNMLWFIIFGTPLAKRLGAFLFIFFWICTAFIAAIIYSLFHLDSSSMLIGASGVISALMGASARYNFQTLSGTYISSALVPIKQAIFSRSVLVILGSFILLNFLTAMDQWTVGFVGSNHIAWEAHLGGLLAGFLTIGLFDKWA